MHYTALAAMAALGISTLPALALDSTVIMTSSMSTDALWKKVGDFCGIAAWHPAIEKCVLSADGKQRTLSLKGGGTLVEALESWDNANHSYVYTMLSGSLPVTNYHSTISVTLVEQSPALLAAFRPREREYARRQLLRRGVEVRLKATIKELTPGEVRLADGTSLPSDIVVWAAGVAAPDSLGRLGLARGHAGRFLVGPDLRIQGEDRVFAAGDVSVSAKDPVAQLAQPAIQEGRHAARQVRLLMAGQETTGFRYHDKGTMATIGSRSAVVELPVGIRLRGTLAWLAWLGLHLFTLLGNRQRLTTLINLTWRYLTWRRGGGMIVGDDPATDPADAPG